MSGEPIISTRPKPTPRTAPTPQLVGEGSKIPSTTPQPGSSKKITKLIPQILLSKRRSKISVKSGSGKSGKSGTSGTSFSQSDIDSMRSAKYEELDMQEEAETRALQYQFKELCLSYSRSSAHPIRVFMTISRLQQVRKALPTVRMMRMMGKMKSEERTTTSSDR